MLEYAEADFKHQQIFVVNFLRKKRMETLQTALTISLITTAIFAAGWKGMIFHNLFNKIEYHIVKISSVFLTKMTTLHRVDKVICKPLFRCAICMSSFWTVVYWLLSGFNFNVVKMILIVAGINTIITALISQITPDEE